MSLAGFETGRFVLGTTVFVARERGRAGRADVRRAGAVTLPRQTIARNAATHNLEVALTGGELPAADARVDAATSAHDRTEALALEVVVQRCATHHFTHSGHAPTGTALPRVRSIIWYMPRSVVRSSSRCSAVWSLA